MDITVNMTEEEFQDFLEYRANREKFAAEIVRVRKAPNLIAVSLQYAVEPVEGKPGKFKITDQEHMADAWDFAKEFMTGK